MAVKLGLWSLTLVPGEKYPLYVKNDFQITNAALSDELRSTDGRSVLKVTHVPVNPAMYDDSDSEIDSDDEDLLGDDDLPEEDEFELDVEEGFKEVEKKPKGVKAKVNGDAEMEEDDDDEEDEEDEEDDDDFSDVEEEVTNVICALTAGKIEQATINLTFTQGDAVMFEITGENAVHLMGNYIMQPNPYDSDSDDEDHEHDDYDEMYDDESDDEETAAFIEELKEAKESKKAIKPASTESKPVKATTKPAAAAASTVPATGDKKRKAEAIDSPASKTPAVAADGDNLSKAQKKKLAKKAKVEDAPVQASTKAAVGGVKVRK